MDWLEIGMPRRKEVMIKELPIIRYIIAGTFEDKHDEKKFRLEIATNESRIAVVIEKGTTTKKMVEHLREIANKLENEYMKY